MKSYYIVFESVPYSGASTKSYRITRTEHDLDTEKGLLAKIKELEKEMSTENLVLLSWRELKEEDKLEKENENGA